MMAIGFIITVIICLGAGGFFKDVNFAEFGMPKNGVGEYRYINKYKYIKEKGELSTILSLMLGSFGMIPLSLIMTVIFFFLNSILYFGLMMGAYNEYGKFYFIPIFIGVRIFNAIFMYTYTKLRLKFIEKDLMRYLYDGKFESIYMNSVNNLDVDQRRKDNFIKDLPKKREYIKAEFEEIKNKSFG